VGRQVRSGLGDRVVLGCDPRASPPSDSRMVVAAHRTSLGAMGEAIPPGLLRDLRTRGDHEQGEGLCPGWTGSPTIGELELRVGGDRRMTCCG